MRKLLDQPIILQFLPIDYSFLPRKIESSLSKELWSCPKDKGKREWTQWLHSSL